MSRRRKSITVEVDVEVDFSEIMTSDLAAEIIDRLKDGDVDEEDMRKIARLVADEYSLITPSLADELKVEYLQRVYGQYSLEEIEKLLPEK